ncbi:MAG TPA: methyltransferase domain-containing protein [Kiritimatiellia bacterium]|nr:methyltransferase domain-containing protein [Kiritimatiellia bacterium]
MTERIHHQHVSARFSAAAQTYIGVSDLQDKVGRRVLEMLPENINPMRILDAGCGPGRLMRLARHRWPASDLVGVDIAEGMIAEAKAAFAGDSNTDFVVSDITNFNTDQAFDLILSSSALHWLKPFDRGLAHVAGLGQKGGVMAIAIMLDGTMSELRQSREAAAPKKQALGRLPTLAELEKAARTIPDTRIRRLEQSASEYDLADAAEVLKTVHAMGVTGGDVSRGPSPLTRSELTALKDYYNCHFATPQGVRVTFSVGYLLIELL